MFTSLTPEEAFELVYEAVERFIDEKDLCWRCAITMASDVTGVARERVQDVWVARQAELAIQP